MMQRGALDVLAGELEALHHGEQATIDRVVIDSRQARPGDLFVALTGERRDGHDFVAAAAELGAAAALVERRQPVALPQLVVADSRRALAQLGAWNRRAFGGPLVAVTGSAGKTSCKDMLAAVLARTGPVLATRGNFNNELGLPLTLLELAPEHRHAVVEMGAARAGDIAWLCRQARPGVGLLTNALPAHLQGMGDVAAVAATKGELLEALPEDGVAILPRDSRWWSRWLDQAGATKVLSFSATDARADVHARNLDHRGLEGSQFELVLQGSAVAVTLALPGAHQVANACAAAAAALALGVAPATIAAGLADLRPTGGRLVPHRLADGRLLIDDSYNANPGAVEAAIEVLAGCPGRRVLLLGEMAELGDSGPDWHRKMGARAAARGIDGLWAVGPSADHTAAGFGPDARPFDDQAALMTALPELEGDVILIKGSRSAAMERIVSALGAITGPEGSH